MKKVKIIGTITIIILLLIVIIVAITNRENIQNNEMEKSAATKTEFAIETKNDNIVLVKFYNPIGIKEIKYPTGDIITCNGKVDVGVDWKVSKNQKYEFTLKDVNDTEKKYTFYSPGVHVELTKNDINIDLNSAKNVVLNNLNNSLVATSFVNVHVVEGERNTVDSSTTDMSEILNSWREIGSSGKWKIVNKEGYVGGKFLANTANQNSISGFISPEDKYTDIDFEFSTEPRDGDNDIVGMLRKSTIWLVW